MNDGTSEPRQRRGGRKPVEIHAGETFGRWVALEEYETGSGRILCRCECGTEQRNDIWSLRHGKTRSCGCLRLVNAKLPRSGGFYLTSGDVHGRLTLLEDAAYSKDLVRALCECGAETKKRAYAIKGGNTRSCGCMRREINLIHGLSGHPLYGIWHGIVVRCCNPDDANYPGYGGRGITLCGRWQGLPDGLLNFAADMGPRPSPKHSVEREDNDGPYVAWNCVWATTATQNANRRSVRKLTAERDALAAEVERLKGLLGDR